MSESAPPHAGFLGTWILVPESCDFEQGEPPTAGVTEIAERDGRLVFDLRWTEADGRAERARFEGAPDGTREPFPGGDLADALAVELVSPRDLRTRAFYKGKERMVSQRQLDDTGTAMRVTQVVIFPDGEHLANVSIYRKQLLP